MRNSKSKLSRSYPSYRGFGGDARETVNIAPSQRADAKDDIRRCRPPSLKRLLPINFECAVRTPAYEGSCCTLPRIFASVSR